MTGRYVRSEGRVLRCAVSTAERGASLQPPAVAEITAALRGIGPKVGAALLVGEGPNFCTGGDVHAFAAADEPGRVLGELAGRFHDLQRAVIAAPVPVVAAVHGWAAGAGMSIVLAADVVVAGRSARLRPAYPAIGFSPDGGMTWLLPRIVGAARARQILLTDQVVGAAAALDLGLISQIVPDDEVVAAAADIARRLAEGPTRALGRIKRLLRDGADRDLDTHLDAETRAIGESAADPEGRAGVAAFVASSRPAQR